MKWDEAKAYRLGECIARAMSAQQIEVLDPPSHWRQIGARTDAAKWVQAQKNHIEKIKKLGTFEVISLAKLKASGVRYKLLNSTWAFCEK